MEKIFVKAGGVKKVMAYIQNHYPDFSLVKSRQSKLWFVFNTVTFLSKLDHMAVLLSLLVVDCSLRPSLIVKLVQMSVLLLLVVVTYSLRPSLNVHMAVLLFLVVVTCSLRSSLNVHMAVLLSLFVVGSFLIFRVFIIYLDLYFVVWQLIALFCFFVHITFEHISLKVLKEKLVVVEHCQCLQFCFSTSPQHSNDFLPTWSSFKTVEKKIK